MRVALHTASSKSSRSLRALSLIRLLSMLGSGAIFEPLESGKGLVARGCLAGEAEEVRNGEPQVRTRNQYQTTLAQSVRGVNESSSYICMRYSYRSAIRLVRVSCTSYPKVNLNWHTLQQRALTSHTFQEIVEMGKDKVPYQLKTPKGTKDCISSNVRFCIESSY